MTAFIPSGSLLLAWPGMADPNFAKSVVLVCQHDARGAYGLVLNRSQGQRVRDLVPAEHLLSAVPQTVYVGGPVDLGRVQYVHALPASVGGGLGVGPDLVLGGNVERLVAILAGAPDPTALPVRFFLGYSGWSAGQLDAELVSGSWYPVEGGARRVMSALDPSAWDRFVEEAAVHLGLGSLAEVPCGN